jgi:hypothetical protein
MYVYFLLIIRYNGRGRKGSEEWTRLMEVQLRWREVNRGREKIRELMAGTEIPTCPPSSRTRRTMGIDSIKACSKCNCVI